MKVKFAFNEKQFANSMKKRVKIQDDELDKGLAKVGFIFRNAVIKGFPVDTGRARSSVHISRGRHIVVIGTNIFYAPYLESGTGIYAIGGGGRKTPWIWKGEGKRWKGWHRTEGMKPRRMFGSAIDKEGAHIRKIIEQAVDKGIKRRA